jgi:DNA-binding NtrC family response regulator
MPMPVTNMREWSSNPDSNRNGTSVLIVDPDGASRDEMVRWLTSAGYAARAARSFGEARRMLGTAAPRVLIATLRLGAFNGLHLVITGRTEHPAMRAIVLTATDDPGVADEARRVQAACLVRPVQRDVLIAAVTGAAAGGPVE